jgi:hypothetical protein
MYQAVVYRRVSGCLPGLHPILLCWFRTGMTAVPVAAPTSRSLLTPSPI